MTSCAPSAPLRAVLFDRDDTIAYTDSSVYGEAARWAARRFGLETDAVQRALTRQWHERAFTWWDLRTPQDEAHFWNTYGEELMDRLGLRREDGAEFLGTYPYERYMKPVPEAREVLGTLRARGLKIGVLSNTLPSIDRTLQALGLADLVDVAVATCALGIHKPEAGAYLHAAHELGVRPAEVLFVDDRAENVEAARALGMPAALIDLRGEQPGALHRLSDVLGLVEAWEASA